MKTRRIQLEIPEQFREHHQTQIVAYMGRVDAGYRTTHDDGRVSAGSRSDDEEAPWIAPCPNRPRAISGGDVDYVLMLPPEYPPHTPVMADGTDTNPDNEAEWQQFYMRYRDPSGDRHRAMFEALMVHGVRAFMWYRNSIDFVTVPSPLEVSVRMSDSTGRHRMRGQILTPIVAGIMKGSEEGEDQ